MRTLFTLFALILSLTLQAQTSASSADPKGRGFVIYEMTGDASIVKSGKPTPAKIGNLLNAGDVILFKNTGKVTLVCSHYHPFKYDKVKSLNISGIKDTCNPYSESLTKAYFHYIWDEFTKGHDHGDSRRKYMKNIAAASRGNNSCPFVTYEPWEDTIIFSGGSFNLNWKSMLPGGKGSLQFFNDVVGQSKITEHPFSQDMLNLNDLLAASKLTEGEYYWGIASVGSTPCYLNYLKVISRQDEDSLIKEFKTAVASDNAAQQHFSLGFMLEERHYFTAALNQYRLAKEADPQNPLYQSVLESFLKQYKQQP